MVLLGYWCGNVGKDLVCIARILCGNVCKDACVQLLGRNRCGVLMLVKMLVCSC